MLKSNAGAIVGSASSDPSTPATGTVYYNTSSHIYKLYNGSSWVSFPYNSDVPLAVNNVGGLRLAWDFNSSDCYDETSPSSNSNIDFVKNIAPDSPNNTEATGGFWVVDPDHILTINTGSGNEKIFRPAAQTNVDAVYTSGSSSVDHGCMMVPYQGSGHMIKSWYFDNNDSTYGTSGQDDNLNAATWVVFQRMHTIITTEQQAALIGSSAQDNPSVSGSWRPSKRYSIVFMEKGANTDDTLNYIASSTGTYDAGLGGLYHQVYNGSSWGYTVDSKYTYDYRTTSGEAVNTHFNMWTYTHSSSSPYTKVLFNDENDSTKQWAIDDGMSYIGGNATNIGYADRDNSGGTAQWTSFGRSNTRSGYPTSIQWSDNTDAGWLVEDNSGTADHVWPADIAVVLYFNKVLSDSERETVYDAYKTRFNLPS
jgi:hypothetical protein